MKKIIIGGDLVPTKSNEYLFINEQIDELISEKLANLLRSADCRIFNLEAPLTTSDKKILKDGPNLKANPLTIDGIKKLGVNLLTLANNHILDYSNDGLFDTINLLENNDIDFVGAGKNLKEASQEYIMELGNLTVGIYACTEHEFTLASNNEAGANPFDPFESLDSIKKISEKVDYLIVLYHGGKEYYKYPTPYLQKTCRKIIEKGANLVLCQHSHCIGCEEDYCDGKIIYGQGNFLFDRDDKIHYNDKQNGLLVELVFENKKPNINLHVIQKEKEKIRLATSKEEERVLKDYSKRNIEITKKNFVDENYKKQALIDGKRYILRFSKFGILFSKIDNLVFNGKICNKIPCFFMKKQRLILQNVLQCEVHNELLLTYLKNTKK